MNCAELKLTDGTTTIDLLSGPIRLRSWTPAIAALKNGGENKGSPFMDGQRLVHGVFDNVAESFELGISALNQDAAILTMNRIVDLLQSAREYWLGGYSTSPVYLQVKARSESNTRYALVHNYSWPEFGNPFAQPFTSRRSFIDSINISIERGHWTENVPGTETAIEVAGYTCVNLVLNGDFEAPQLIAFSADTGGAVFIEWTETGSPTVNVETDTVYNGWYSAHITSTGTDDGIYQDVTKLPSGSTWTITVKAWADAGSISLVAYDGGGTSNAITDTTSTTGEWETLSVEKTATGGGIRVALIAEATDGDGYFDECHIDSCYGNIVTATGAPVGYFSFVGGGDFDSANATSPSNQILFPGDVEEFGLGNNDAGDGELYHRYAIRATNVLIPNGAIITNAYIRFVATQTIATATVDISFKCADEDDAAKLSTYGDLVGRTLTTAGVTGWNPGAWTSGEYYDSPDISAPIQEVVNRAGWESGNHLMVVCNGSLSDTDAIRWFSTKPTLHIAYQGIDTSSVSGTTPSSTSGEVFVTNNDTRVSLTDVYSNDQSAGTFSDNIALEPMPFAMFQSTNTAVNDAMYFGIEQEGGGTGISSEGSRRNAVFNNIVFNLSQAASATTSYTILWEYYNGSWTEIPGVIDNTSQLSVTGVSSVHWIPPSDWATTAINSVTAYWVRARVSALTGTFTSPIQQTNNFYTCSWAFVEIESDQLPGNLPALARSRYHNVGAPQDQDVAYQPTASTDDAYVNVSGTSIDTSADFIEIGEDRGGGVRFQAVAIPQGSTIIRATLEGAYDAVGTTDTCIVTIYGEDVDDSAAFSTYANFAGRTRTTAGVVWTPDLVVSIPGSGPRFTPPDVTAVVQEIVDRAGWASGNDLALLIDDNGSDANARRKIVSYDDGADTPLTLRIQYIEAGNWISKAIVATRATDRGTNFTPYIMATKEYLPLGVTVQYGPYTRPLVFEDSPSGKVAHFSGLEETADTYNDRVIWRISPLLAPEYVGRYRAIVRSYNSVASESTSFRLKIKNGSGGQYLTSAVGVTTSNSGFDLVDLREITIPPSEIGYTELEIILQIKTAAGISDVYVSELILMPADEWIGEFVDVAGLPNSGVSGLSYLDVDSITPIRDQIIGASRKESNDMLQGRYRTSSSFAHVYPDNKKVRVWSVVATNKGVNVDSSADDFVSEYSATYTAEFGRNARYLTARGAN